jgi:hypothetical protein
VAAVENCVIFIVDATAVVWLLLAAVVPAVALTVVFAAVAALARVSLPYARHVIVDVVVEQWQAKELATIQTRTNLLVMTKNLVAYGLVAIQTHA